MKDKKCNAAVCGHRSSLYRAMGLLALACAAVAPTASFAAEYTDGMDSIVLMQGSYDGQTNTLAEAIAAYNTANGTSYDISSFNGGDLAAYALVKEGDGTLVMDTAIQSYTGPIVIKDGVVKCMCQYALGADVADHHTYVRDGATLWVNRVLTADGKSDAPVNSYRVLHVAGTGHNGQGAVLALNTQTSYNFGSIYGGVMHLDADATIYHPVWAYITKDLYLNGHTLTVGTIYKNPKSPGATDAIWDVDNIYGNGRIVLDDSVMYCTAEGRPTLNDASEGNEFEMGNRSGIRMVRSHLGGVAKDVWPIRFTGPTGFLWGDALDESLRFQQSRNRLNNQIILENGVTIDMLVQWGPKQNWVKLHGPISGNGGFNLSYANNQPPKRLSLVNPGNSFSGPVAVDKGIVYVYEPGSLPAGSPVTVSRSKALDAGFVPNVYVPIDYHGLEFVAPGEQTLGPLTFTAVKDGEAYHSGRIQGGSGTFSRIDKQSPNTMEYYSGIGSPLLNVEGGTFKLPRGPAPGLWEGTNNTQNAGGQSGNASWAFVSKATSTNLVARGPNLLNNTSVAHYGAPSGNNRINTYDGYIWNRETTSVTWTFATSIGQYACVYVDGQQVVYYSYISDSNHTSPAHQFNQVTLEPGPHSFQVRTCCATVRSGGGWPANFGFVYDKLGRSVSQEDYPSGNFSAITNNFELLLDPGDGSLFTRSIDEADLPHFDEMRFAAGTTLDVNGNAYVASVVSGWPTVVSTAEDPSASPSLTITNSFVVNAADLVGENPPRMAVAMPLSFGATGGVTVTNLANLTYGHYTIAEVTGDGNTITSTGETSLRSRCVFDVDNRWAVNLSADGTKLMLEPQAGMKIIIR